MVLAPMFSAHILSVKKTLIREEMQRQKKAVKQDKTIIIQPVWGFPGSSAGKESVCNAGDPGSIPGLGRSPEEKIGYPFQYSLASLVAQLIKILPAMQETCIRFLGEKVPLRRERLPTPVFWPGNSVDCIVHGVPKNWTGLSDLHFHFMANVQCLCLARRCHLYSVPVTKQKWNLVYILTCMLTVCSVSPVLVWKSY